MPVPTSEIGAVLYEIDCSGGAGIALLITATCGNVQFQLSIDDGAPIPFPPDGVLNASGLAAGTHKFELLGIPTNLLVTVSPSNPVFLNVPAGGTVQLDFFVNCANILGALNVRFVVVPEDPITDPIDVLLDGVVAATVGPTNSRDFTVRLDSLVLGSLHDVTLDFGTGSCSIVARDPALGLIPVPGTVRYDLKCL